MCFSFILKKKLNHLSWMLEKLGTEKRHDFEKGWNWLTKNNRQI
jgi:hypothetical protein